MDMKYGKTQVDAIDAWWRAYGRRWTAVRELVRRGWDEGDVLAEVHLSAASKSAAASGWDPMRGNVHAWAGLIGRSRVRHLLARRAPEAPLADAEDKMGLEPGPVPWSVADAADRVTGTEEQAEARAALGLAPVERAPAETAAMILQEQAQMQNADSLFDLFD